MNESFYHRIELLCARENINLENTNLFARPRVAAEIGESVIVGGVIIPVIATNSIEEKKMGVSSFKSNIYLVSLTKEEFEKYRGEYIYFE